MGYVENTLQCHLKMDKSKVTTKRVVEAPQCWALDWKYSLVKRNWLTDYQVILKTQWATYSPLGHSLPLVCPKPRIFVCKWINLIRSFWFIAWDSVQQGWGGLCDAEDRERKTAKAGEQLRSHQDARTHRAHLIRNNRYCTNNSTAPHSGRRPIIHFLSLFPLQASSSRLDSQPSVLEHNSIWQHE